MVPQRHHRYSCLEGKTPFEALKADDIQPLALGAKTKLPLIRLILNSQILDIFAGK